MAGKMGKETYLKMLDEDLAWLLKQPRTLERDHIVQILKDSVRFYYGETAPSGDDLPRTGPGSFVEHLSQFYPRELVEAAFAPGSVQRREAGQTDEE